MKKTIVRVPASTANLGPGFDSFFDAIEQTLASIPDLRKHDD